MHCPVLQLIMTPGGKFERYMMGMYCVAGAICDLVSAPMGIAIHIAIHWICAIGKLPMGVCVFLSTRSEEGSELGYIPSQ